MRSSSKLTVGLAILAMLTVVDSALAYYSPSLGRFINRDPVGEPGHMLVQQVAAATFLPRDPITIQARPNVRGVRTTSFLMRDPLEPGGPNRYAFVYNQPTGLYDPLGEQCGGPMNDAVRKCIYDDFADCSLKCTIKFVGTTGIAHGAYERCMEQCGKDAATCLRYGGGGVALPAPITPLPSDSSECDKYACTDEYQNANARCFCKCAGDSPWSNLVRGCLRQMYEAGVCPREAHTACYMLADSEVGDRPWTTLAWCYAKCFDYNPLD